MKSVTQVNKKFQLGERWLVLGPSIEDVRDRANDLDVQGEEGIDKEG